MMASGGFTYSDHNLEQQRLLESDLKSDRQCPQRSDSKEKNNEVASIQEGIEMGKCSDNKQNEEIRQCGYNKSDHKRIGTYRYREREVESPSTVGFGRNIGKNYEVSWIKKYIKMRKCSRYTEFKTKDICQCGNSKKDHKQIPVSSLKQEDGNPSTQLKWDLFKDTETVATNAFGRIEFYNFGGNIGKFVRVDRETKMDTILQLMMKVWGMEKPNLLISVTGGAGKCNIKPHLRDVFQRGLMKAANSTGAWIITGGTNTGVTKHVGKAVKAYGLTSANQKSVIAIGIAPWGIIGNRNALEANEGSWPAKYYIEREKEKSFLDPNHSHFILVDDGTNNKYGTEKLFRDELEQKISEMKTDTGDDNTDLISLGRVVSAVPTVILVLEGGASTLQTVQNAIQRNIPAVIIKGSGGAADILADTFRIKKSRSLDLKAEIRKQMETMRFSPKDKIDNNIKLIMHCLSKPDLIHVFDWNCSSSDTRGMDAVILKALLKANKHLVMDHLGLALAWNMIDIAKSEIFTAPWLPNHGLEDIMLLAIKMHRVNFVELLLDNVVTKVNLKEFLTIKRLLLLYNNVSSRSLLKFLFNKMRLEKNEVRNKEITLKEVGQLIQNLLGDYYGLQYDIKTEEQNSTFDNPERELFIWSVLNTQQGMAELFCLRGKDAIAAVLVGSALYSAMSHRTDDMELKKRLEANADKFTKLAIAVLKESHCTDEYNAQCLLLRNVSQWKKISCMEIAVKTKNKQFISQMVFQDLFKSIWYKDLKHENGTLRLLICTVIPPLIPLLVKFKTNEDNDHATHSSVKIQQRSNHQETTRKSQPFQQAEGTKGDYVKSKKEKISSFYKTPVAIFCQNVISYMVFLCLFSYILTCKLDKEVSVEECILIVWVFTIFAEEIKQACTRVSFRSYITDGWNIIDVITIVLFLFGTILRFIPGPGTLEAASVFLAVDLITFYMRLLHIFCVHKKIGPKLVMIIHTVKSVIYFCAIFLVFIVAYAIASHAILYPNTELNHNTLIAIFRRPYWNIYGELMLDEIEGVAGCTNDAELYGNRTYPRCPTESGKYFVPVLMGVYMFASNILLLNLLIVMFSDAYSMVEHNVTMYWNLQLLSLINEYYSRPVLAPPFILIMHVYQLITFFYKKLKDPKYCAPMKSAFLSDFAKETEEKLSKWEYHIVQKVHGNESERILEWEDSIADKLHHKRDPEDLYSMSSRVKSTDLQVDQLVRQIDEMQKQQQALTETIKDIQSTRMEYMEMLHFIKNRLGDRRAGSEVTDD